jgi:hypothetical protein
VDVRHRRALQLLRKQRHAIRHLHILREPRRRIMRALVVDVQARRGSRAGEPVHGHPVEDLVVRPGAAVRPLRQLLEHPREQPRGAVGQRVAERLRARGLLLQVPDSFFGEPLRARGARGGHAHAELVLEVVERALERVDRPASVCGLSQVEDEGGGRGGRGRRRTYVG